MVAHPMGMCEKIYNAFTSGPSMLPFRRSRLTSGTSMIVTAEGPKQSDHAQLQAPGDAPTAKVGPNTAQEKAVVPSKADVIVLKSTPEEEILANRIADPATRRMMPEPLPEQPKIIRRISSAAKAGKEATPPEKDKVDDKTVEPMTQHRSPTSVVPRAATEKGNMGTMTLTVPTVAAEKGKAAVPAMPPTSMARRTTTSMVVPPTATAIAEATSPIVPPKTTPNVKAAPAVMPLTATANGKATTHAVTSEKGKTAPPTVGMAVTGKDNAATITAAASIMEKEKAAPPVSSITDINERSEDFIRRAKNSMQSFSTLDGDQK